ncbi:MAG: hypothetical protein LBN74_01570 [Prevotella sp.]|jgi:hypothetical protein|nr:hypothetical protein [Prevotella sp.]
MRKIAILAVMCVCCLTELFAVPQPEDDSNKLVLSGFILKDAKIGHVTSDISNFIFRRKNGYLWPVTKVIFSKEKDVLKLDIIAIDNEWHKLLEPGEKTQGYFIVNNRIFIISTRENEQINLAEYFDPVEDSTRTFASSAPKKIIKNPEWVYVIDKESTFPKQLYSANVEVLGR